MSEERVCVSIAIVLIKLMNKKGKTPEPLKGNHEFNFDTFMILWVINQAKAMRDSFEEERYIFAS